MNGGKGRVGLNLLFAGIIIFVIGLYLEPIIESIYGHSNYVRILGLLLQIAGGLLGAYGLMTTLDEMAEQPPQPGFPTPPLMIRETKKMIWVFIIVALIVFIAAPGSQCSSIIMVLLVLALIFLIFREQRQPYPFPPPQYPMHPGYQVQPPPAQSGKVTLCSNCYAQLELDWVACPFCGQTVKTAEKTAEQKQDNAT